MHFFTCTFFAALFKALSLTLFCSRFFSVLVTRLFDLVVAGPLDIEPLTLWPGSALIWFSFVSPAYMTPSSRDIVAKRDLTIQSVPACYSIKSNRCVLDEEELAPL